MTTSHRHPELHPADTGPSASADAVASLARILDPVAFAPLPTGANLGQLWSQIDRKMTARLHADRALTAGYQPPATRPAQTEQPR